MSKLCIIMAEDSRPDVFLIRRALSGAGLDYELLVAEDGEKALTLVDRIGQDLPIPDVLLMDLDLPKTQGAEIIRRFRQHPGCASVPVIVVTSSDSPGDLAMANELAVEEYFRKPSTLDEFMRLGDVVRNVVEKRQSGG
jgi:chemotaxis family two-component system response regulator Rcp1